MMTAYCLKRTHARANVRRLFISPQYPSRQTGGGRDGGSCGGRREREREGWREGEKQAGCHCFHRGIHYGGAALKSAPAAMRAARRAHAALLTGFPCLYLVAAGTLARGGGPLFVS